MERLPPGYAEVQQIVRSRCTLSQTSRGCLATDQCAIAIACAQNEILQEPEMAGSRLLELISSLRRERPRYKLTKHCLYLATVSHLTPRPVLLALYQPRGTPEYCRRWSARCDAIAVHFGASPFPDRAPGGWTRSVASRPVPRASRDAAARNRDFPRLRGSDSGHGLTRCDATTGCAT
eukprot:COSAG02_NODE_5542_length_4244_cov_2.738963_5_plen_178_part_00